MTLSLQTDSFSRTQTFSIKTSSQSSLPGRLWIIKLDVAVMNKYWRTPPSFTPRSLAAESKHYNISSSFFMRWPSLLITFQFYDFAKMADVLEGSSTIKVERPREATVQISSSSSDTVTPLTSLSLRALKPASKRKRIGMNPPLPPRNQLAEVLTMIL